MPQERFELVCHPATPTSYVGRVYAFIGSSGSDPGERTIQFHVQSVGPILLPPPGKCVRADDLWRATCFEMFLRPEGGEVYLEFNFSPSSDWAAYRFDGYRDGRRDLDVTFDPEIWVSAGDGRNVSLDIDVDVSSTNAQSCAMALSAVIEEIDGTKSYWALAHAPGPPDFHNPACFTATLPPPDRP
jgi:hypothetical protein